MAHIGICSLPLQILVSSLPPVRSRTTNTFVWNLIGFVLLGLGALLGILIAIKLAQ